MEIEQYNHVTVVNTESNYHMMKRKTSYLLRHTYCPSLSVLYLVAVLKILSPAIIDKIISSLVIMYIITYSFSQ